MKTEFLLLFSLLLVSHHAQAATRTWQGGSINWSDPDNWSPAGPPQSGDDLVFPYRFCQVTELGCTTHNNDLNNLVVGRLTFTGNHTIGGNTITVTNGIFAAQDKSCLGNAPVVINCGLALPAAEVIFEAAPQNELRLNG